MTCPLESDTQQHKSHETHDKAIKVIQCSTSNIDFISKLIGLMECETETSSCCPVFITNSDPLEVINEINESGCLELKTCKRLNLILEMYI